MSPKTQQTTVSAMEVIKWRGKPICVEDQYGSYTVLSYAGRNKHGHLTFMCRCVCGTVKVIAAHTLKQRMQTQCRTCANQNKPPYKRRSGTVKSPSVDDIGENILQEWRKVKLTAD